MARPAKPRAVKEARGNPGRRKLPAAQAIEGPQQEVAPPAELKGTGRKIWERLAAELHNNKLLTVTSRDALARYCQYLGEWWRMTEVLRRGRTYRVKSKHGSYIRPRPEVNMRRQTELSLQALEEQFGLTPRARYQIIQQLLNQGQQPKLPFDDETPQGAEEADSPLGYLN